MAKLRVLALDLGASNGRGIIGSYDGTRMELADCHRFENGAITVNGGMYWNILGLYRNILESITKAAADGPLAGVAIDTWGVDYALLDRAGNMLASPRSYRDGRTNGALERVAALVNDDEMYAASGLQMMNINTLYQLKSEPAYLIENAETMLNIPDLLNYFLTGKKMSEQSIASTTQLLATRGLKWNTDLIARVGLPERLFAPVRPSGTILGDINGDARASTGVYELPVIMSGAHDTASAVVATPAVGDDWVFLSCGTWSLLGVESDEPVINAASRAEQYSNEKGAFQKTLFLRNITGLWLLQEVRRIWKLEGRTYNYVELGALAREAGDIPSIIDTDDPAFTAPENMVRAIREYCVRTRQPEPETVGQVVRCILQSLALKYRLTIDKLEKILGKKLNVINMIGGGVNNTLLCELTANCTGRTVVAGPDEATAMGNLLLQAYALGELKDLSEIRAVVRASVPTKTYTPVRSDRWDELYARFQQL